MQRAHEKSEVSGLVEVNVRSLLVHMLCVAMASQIQKMVISGGDFKSDALKPKEVVSLLLDDEEMESRCKDAFPRDI